MCFIHSNDEDISMKVRDRFSGRDDRPRSIAPADGPSMTKQSFKDEADINNITSRYIKTGYMPQGSRMPLFGDFTTSGDFMEAQNVIAEVKQNFERLPAKLRRRFDNNPFVMLRWLENPVNKDEALKMGLIELSPEAQAKAEDAAKAAAVVKPDDEANPHKKAPEGAAGT